MGVVLALVAAVLWGLTPVATKAALAGWSPELIAVIRLAAAAVLFRSLGGAGARWLPRDRWTSIAGIALGADFLLYNYGLRFTTAGLASLVVNVEVVTTIVFAGWLLDERLTARRAVGALVTFGGVVYVASDGLHVADLVAREHLVGNALVMVAGTSWSLYAVAQRRAPRARNLFELMAPIFTVATLATVPGLAAPSAWSVPGGTQPTVMLAALIVLCTVAVYVIYARAQELLDVTALAIVLTSIPIFAIALAAALLGESVSTRAVLGGAVVIAGVLVIATERHAGAGVPEGIAPIGAVSYVNGDEDRR